MGKMRDSLKNLIRKKNGDKPAKMHKAALSLTRKSVKGRHSNTFFDTNDKGELSSVGLEETPTISVAGGKRSRKSHRTTRMATKAEVVRIGVLQTQEKTRHTKPSRYKEGCITRLKNRVSAVFGAKKTEKKNTALEFAASQKRSGRKGRRNKRVALYTGSGLVIVAVVLVVFFGTKGEAATPPPITTNDSAAASAVVLSTEDNSQTRSVEQYAYGSSDVTEQLGISSVETTVPTTGPTVTPTEGTVPVETTPPDETAVPINVADLVEDFRVEADLYYNEVGYSTNHYEYTEDDVYMLAQLITGEARGESYEGMVAVGNVVMNRVLLRGHFGSTVKQVVTARGQFTGYSSSIRPSSSCLRAARSVLAYENWVIPQNVYYFRSGAKSGVDWYSHPFYKKIGGHCFYTHRYYGRSRIDSVSPPLFERTFQWPQYGCKREARVYRIQYMLKSLGYKVGTDKYFGMDTKEAVQEFQADMGLDADGVAGPSTIKALINKFGVVEYYTEFCL